MRILFFPFADFKIGGPRIRVGNIHNELIKKGYDSKVFPPENRINYFLRYFNIFKGDILHFQKTVDPITVIVMLIAKLLNKKIIIDIDMNFYEVNPFKMKLDISFIKKINRLINRESLKFASRIVDIIIVDNVELKKIAKKYNKNVYLLEASIDLEGYIPKKKYDVSKEIIIGWIGNGITHRRNLELLIKPINELGKKYKIKFILIGALHNKRLYDSMEEIRNVKVEMVDEIDWENTKLVCSKLRSFDIAVAPMLDIKENRAKDLYKVREYMALRVPLVTSFVGQNKYLVKEGVDGLFARNSEEWIKKIEMLIKDKKLRERIGLKGREKIEENYSVEKIADKFMKILKQL